MIEIKNKQSCCGCHACFQICPVDAIKMVPDCEGFLYPIVDNQKCVNCGMCEKVCPELIIQNTLPVIKTYATYRRNFEKRLESASGGIFAVLAEFVLQNNGVVFGAAFDDKWNLRHYAVDSIDELHNLKGSKYLQSTIGTTFKEAEKYLKCGKMVLFSGTPCQIQGLKKYLKVDNFNLITVDLICHGVPSPKVWKQYLKETSKGRKLEKFKFRDKRMGIKDAPLFFDFENGDVIFEKYSESPYIRGFINNLYLRPSCYKCSFKSSKRCSDFTIGDFWGIENFLPEFDNKYGVSAVMLRTKKAIKIFSLIKNELIIAESSVDQIVIENPCYSSSVIENPKREYFFKMWRKNGVIRAVKKLLRPTIMQYLVKKKNQIIAYLWIIKKKILGERR